MTPEQIAAGLSPAMCRMLVNSEPDDVTGREGCGVDLFNGADYAVAKALERRGLGYQEGPGGFRYAGLYWSNSKGLAIRTILLEQEKPDA